MKTKFSRLVPAVVMRRWWVGPLVVGLTIAVVAIARATVPDASGVAGVSSWELVTGKRMLPSNFTAYVVATCPSGKFVFGGCYTSFGGAATALSSHPRGNDSWWEEFKTGSGVSVPATVYAICAKAS